MTVVMRSDEQRWAARAGAKKIPFFLFQHIAGGTGVLCYRILPARKIYCFKI